MPMQARAELLSVLPAPQQDSTGISSALAVPKETRPQLSRASAAFLRIFGFYGVLTTRSEAPQDQKRGIFEMPLFLRGSDDTKRGPEAPKRGIFENLWFL